MRKKGQEEVSFQTKMAATIAFQAGGSVVRKEKRSFSLHWLVTKVYARAIATKGYSRRRSPRSVLIVHHDNKQRHRLA
jgi:hypothetical protein